jgi:hypothetical protein
MRNEGIVALKMAVVIIRVPFVPLRMRWLNYHTYLFMVLCCVHYCLSGYNFCMCFQS